MRTRQFFERQKRGQSTIEFTVLAIIVIGALLAAQVYFKRSIQGRWKTAADELTDELYDPYLTDSNVVYRTASNSVVEVTTLEDGDGFWTMREDHTNSLDTRAGKTLIGGFN